MQATSTPTATASRRSSPGYSFPRLPSAAVIPGERRTQHGLATSSSGPGSSAISVRAGCVHLSRRRQLPGRAGQPAGPRRWYRGQHHRAEALQCLWLPARLRRPHQRRGARVLRGGAAGHRDLHDAPLSAKRGAATGSAADEEERQRAGLRDRHHRAPAGLSGEEISGTATPTADKSSWHQHLPGDNVSIRRMNIGLRRRKHTEAVAICSTPLRLLGQGSRPGEAHRRGGLHRAGRPARRTGGHAWSRLLLRGRRGRRRRCGAATEDGQLAVVARKALELHLTPTPARTGTGPRTPARTAPRLATTAYCRVPTSGITSTWTAIPSPGYVQRLTRRDGRGGARRGALRAAGAARTAGQWPGWRLDVLDKHGHHR